jgi:hypothetical protein
MADFLATKRREIDARLKELGPLVAEYDRLERALAALDMAAGSSRRGGRRKPQGSSRRRRGRPGQRAQQALEALRRKPGMTVAELAQETGIESSYAYRVVATLERQGSAVKRDGGWHAVARD